jgi:hypothetical protein
MANVTDLPPVYQPHARALNKGVNKIINTVFDAALPAQEKQIKIDRIFSIMESAKRNVVDLLVAGINNYETAIDSE